MKTTTLPAIKIGKNQVLLPSGVVSSKDGKYHYWRCSVSGLMTFAKPDYWVKVMAKFKTEENLVKTYVCKKAKNLLKEGFTQSEIIVSLSAPKTSADRKANAETKKIKTERKALTKKVRKPSLKKMAVGFASVIVQTNSGSFQTEIKPVYPWQTDVNYFKGSGITPMSFAAATNGSCAYPNRNIDDQCRGCPAWNDCVASCKYTEDDWKKPRNPVAPKVTKIASFSV